VWIESQRISSFHLHKKFPSRQNHADDKRHIRATSRTSLSTDPLSVNRWTRRSSCDAMSSHVRSAGPPCDAAAL
jgi:hypothetical protein